MPVHLSRTTLLFVAGSCGALLLAGCSSSGGAKSTPPTQPSSSKVTSAPASGPVGFATASNAKGTILTDAGRTVYTYDPDTSTASNCTGSCASTWPPVIGTAAAGPSLQASSFGTITRADGAKQVTYDGHPVYAYSADTRVGDVNGDGVEGVWHVVVVTPATSSAPSTGSTGDSSTGRYGGGY
ncbi:MAG: hypothetical protein ABI232_12530 [Jatrophihabitantaceae bacterium]